MDTLVGQRTRPRPLVAHTTMSPTPSQILSVAFIVATVFVVQFAPAGAAPAPVQLTADPAQFAGSVVPVTAGASSPIDSCRTIAEEGRYHLVADLVSHTYTCLDIEADNVVLDGRGHALTVAESARAYGAALGMPTPDQFGEAVVVTGGRSNVTIANLSFEGFDSGIRTTGGADLSVINVTGTNAVTGVAIDDVSRVRVMSTTIVDSAGDGLVIRNATDVTIDAVTVNASWMAGIVVDGSDRVSIQATTVSRNHGDGLFITGSTDVVTAGLVASENAVGVLVIGSDGTTVTTSTLDRNAIAGIAVLRADGVTVADSTISNTVGDPGAVGVERTAGVLTVDARNTTLRDVRVFGNYDWTIVGLDSASVVVERVTAGSTVVSFAATDVSIELHSLVDRPCSASTAASVSTDIERQATASDGVAPKVTVTCVR
ncbi:right-handed parallel beta-helix repeat-containing protein [Halogeometricum sp. S1BR25-6]|uniref:Right-handed parallel beta-helix repeat-containing protein n=1 Tax=Halogeometricum salsisoli TaxID=2950536 RepID=A0ABU2GJJ2_9EURY|nr:right-handed parallel beta-helix repeat-containing protein [Halogeometricum sp. S1BR25-6]MDS0300993.1 right-handed parallel beta-helix repeat-containing protein [Halogeometricum sp. S1BR25-6]